MVCRLVSYHHLSISVWLLFSVYWRYFGIGIIVVIVCGAVTKELVDSRQ